MGLVLELLLVMFSCIPLGEGVWTSGETGLCFPLPNLSILSLKESLLFGSLGELEVLLESGELGLGGTSFRLLVLFIVMDLFFREELLGDLFLKGLNFRAIL